MKRKILGLCVGMLLVTGCGKVAKLSNGEDSVVTFKDDTKISVNDFYNKIKNSYGLETLLSMIDTYIYETEFKDQVESIKNKSDAQVDAYIEIYGGESELISAINQTYGFDFQNIKAVREYFYYSFLTNHAISEYAKNQITEDQMKNYYNNEAIGDMEIHHILITPETKENATEEETKTFEEDAKKKAKSIIDELTKAKKNNEDVSKKFSELAKEYSKDSATKDSDGSLGRINYGTLSNKYDELINSAVNLKDGEFSKTIITTELGYHVIYKAKSYEKEDYDKLKSSIKETLGKRYQEKNQNSIGYDATTAYRKQYKMNIQDDELKSQYNTYITNLYSKIQTNK